MLRHVLPPVFGVAVGLVAAAFVNMLDASPPMMFGVGMLYGSLCQLVAQRLFARPEPVEYPQAPEAARTLNRPGREKFEVPPLVDGASR